MPFQPGTIGCIKSLTGGGHRVHRFGKWKRFTEDEVEVDERTGRRWIVYKTLCGRAEESRLEVDDKIQGVPGTPWITQMVRLWLRDAVKLGLPFCKVCYRPEDRPDDPAHP